MSTTANVDFSKDIAVLLKEGTAAAHERAEHSQGAGWLVRGELERDEYARFLMMLYHIYDALERGLERHATHPVLAPTHNPTLFARTQSLAEDISHLLQTPQAAWQSHPIHVELTTSAPKPFIEYTSRIQYLADSDPARLLAHAYVRYLGDLSGGQFIKRRISKAYGLDDSAGVAFYEFKQLGGNASSTQGDIKKIKEWFRDGMNEGVGQDVALKAAVLDEAVIAFDLNTGLFTTLRPSSRARTPESPVPAILGNPQSPTFDSFSPPFSPSPETTSIKKDTEALPVASAPSNGTFPLTSVLSFIIALCLSHFVLVLGGFTGEKGYAKLETVFQYITGLFSS